MDADEDLTPEDLELLKAAIKKSAGVSSSGTKEGGGGEDTEMKEAAPSSSNEEEKKKNDETSSSSEETKKEGEGESSSSSAAAAEGGGGAAAAEELKEPAVNEDLLRQLVDDMGFPRVRAVKGLFYADNSLEAAITWLTDHCDDSDIDSPLLLSSSDRKHNSSLSFDERKKKLDEILEKKRKENAEKQKVLEKLQEIDRIRSSKELTEARRKQEEQEKRRIIEETQREKERQQKERERLRMEIEKDKMERLAKMGKLPAAKEEEKKDPAAEQQAKQMAKVRNSLRKLYTSCRYPEDLARKAMELARRLVENIANSPAEEKFKSIRCSNPALSANLLSKGGGVELLVAAGFEREGEGVEEKLVYLKNPVDVEWLQTVAKEINAAIAKGPFY